ncbi:MAG: Glutamine amidotransferase type 1 [Paenibacillaceae bacterium]|nr:Glutamine amidotransferase type 1 [Paenibacillaceae bacterium]
MRLHYLQHIPLENPGSILAWAKERGHSLSHTFFFDGEPLPELQDFDWLVIMGGPMNIYEEERYPWLAAEKELIRQSIEAGKVLLGICLGSQLIADVIGGKVTTNKQPEIGWFPVYFHQEAREDPLFSVFPEEPVVFHWHYDTFSVLPEEAQVYAYSAACKHQAYVYRGRVFGFQFHLENTAELLQGYIAESGNELNKADYVQTAAELIAHPEYLVRNNEWMAAFLTRLEEKMNRGEL